ncbi:MAG: hypothetical protein M3O61_12030 [Gemmatimonadota bacterium]|nr:hypothetical protein [Gemmatimonadota bacterium]
MTCEQCLTAVSAMSLQEAVSDPVIRKHWEECKDCSHVLTVVATAERDLSDLLRQQSSAKSAMQTAETAVSRVKRRRLGIVVSAFLATLLAATLWIAWVRLVVPAARETVELASSQHLTETLELKCLSPAEAGTLISPYVRANGSLYYLPTGGLRVITVKATPEEMKTVRSLLGRFDSAPAGSCRTGGAP